MLPLQPPAPLLIAIRFGKRGEVDKKIAHAMVGYFFDAGGEDGNRTRLNGFAGRCITSLLPRLRKYFLAAQPYRGC